MNLYHRAVLVVLFLAGASWGGEQAFKDLVGNVPVGPVASTAPLQVPFITWGGDMVTFYANKGLKTGDGSIYKKLGLDLNLVLGDDFPAQVKDYLAGKSPFLRGTFHMVGMASEVISQDPKTRGVVFLQLTWSAGDHMVARKDIRFANDLKGQTIVLQRGGPHIGMLDDILKSANLKWDDVSVLWAKDLTATPDSPAEIFRKNPKVAACFCISPDMTGLCGGLDKVGGKAEGQVDGCRVLVSTAQLSFSIADVYVCRKDFYDANKELVTKFVAGYLKGCEELLDLKKEYETKKASAEYTKVLQMGKDIFGKDAVPTLEDAHGMLCDCTFVGHPGNVAFFTKKDNLHGFTVLNDAALKLAVERGFAIKRYDLLPHDMDYGAAAFDALTMKGKVATRTTGEIVDASFIDKLNVGDMTDDKTILRFDISFEPNQETFSAQQYAAQYEQAIKMADRYGNAVVAIKGHSDPTKALGDFVKTALQKGLLVREGQPGAFTYTFKGKPLDLTKTADVIKAIEGPEIESNDAESNPKATLASAAVLSRQRAEAVKRAILDFAKTNNWVVEDKRFKAVGVGIQEPVVPKPKDMDEARKNMRVEFRLVKVPAEAIKKSDFDY